MSSCNLDRGFWRAVLDGVDRPILVTTPEGTISEFNAAAETLLGYRADEVIGTLPLTHLHDGSEIARRARALSLELGVTVEPGFDTFVAMARSTMADASEWGYLRKDGGRVRVQLSVKAIHGLGGALVGLMVTPTRGTGSKLESREPTNGSPSFAPDEALRRLNGDAALLDEVVAIFLQEQPALYDVIRRAVAERNAKGLERCAHKLRGALLNLAALPAARIAGVVEDYARRGIVPALGHVDALGSELDRLSAALSLFRTNGGAS
jgi:PAS domain S-box-containing protein